MAFPRLYSRWRRDPGERLAPSGKNDRHIGPFLQYAFLLGGPFPIAKEGPPQRKRRGP
jgi:hypothetical protein